MQLDRFIPARSGIDFENAAFALAKENGSSAGEGGQADGPSSPSKEDYQKALAASLSVSEGRILAFKQKAPAAPEGYENGLKTLYNQNLGPAPAKKAFRHVPTTQERILDAPELMDDYYLNLLDWSCQNLVRMPPPPCVLGDYASIAGWTRCMHAACTQTPFT